MLVYMYYLTVCFTAAPGAPWQIRQKNVIMNPTYQVVIEARLDSSYSENGVFALDDLQIYSGLCRPPREYKINYFEAAKMCCAILHVLTSFITNA